ncbi:conserved hypothetical protein [uncultured Eubacteriales bacterium]|uniref:Fluoroacetyl-CoA-specific thioesterase-like domain-containing protein n=1 Tax=uncultured Eubacteriales bacterium TaxID=172733 RepID=A0A212K1E7_9FIRM|nr:conserved hypothetical protein [uncultured Eubacteriales bacterium]
MSIAIGTKGRADALVMEENTAAAVGSGSLSVFATPSLAALMERAAVEALAPYLAEGESSVGTSLSIAHDAATPVGMTVWAEAEVTTVDRRKISFTVRAFDSAGQIGSGTHERFLVDAAKFTAKAQSRKGT